MTEKRPRGRPRNPDGPKPHKPKRKPDPRIRVPKAPGRPRHEPTVTSKGLVRMALISGWTHDAIAAASGIDPKTFRKHYAEEIRTARFEIDGALMQTAIMIALGGNGPLARWQDADPAMLRWVKERFFGAKPDTLNVNHAGAVGAYDLDKLGKDGLLQLREILSPLAIAGPDRRGDSEDRGPG